MTTMAMMMSSIYKRAKYGILVAACVLFFTGCADSHADAPEFTTSSDRNTGFVPKTFQQHEKKTNEEAEEISNEVENGTASVKEKAAAMSEELETVDYD